MSKAVLSAMVRPLIEQHLPAGIDAHWFMSADEAKAEIVDADIAWVDLNDPAAMREVVSAGTKLKWLSTIYAGLDHFPVEQLAAQGTVVTNGVGINTIAVAEYAVLGMLSLAKGYADVVRSADKAEWLQASPGVVELYETKALVIGYGAIGRAIGARLEGFGVEVTGVARTARPAEGIIGADDWQTRIGEFDWIILAMPATDETEAMFGAAELEAMKKDAFLVNIARGSCVDQDALVSALQDKAIAGAFLDVVTPEPLPANHVLWTLPNVQLSMHLSGRAQSKMFARSAELFIKNTHAWVNEEPLTNRVDLSLGY
ncbi:D-2-hydroxyacid dehydrogenase [Sphingorhabdus sp. Alg239-R122]|uniref:D-2-hydroxyacid dehydrogenase n=1 Tax=Sphingorhabdus sp. Alg239-R122 TaxID=2305989 RepID=UPI0013D97D1E|nr:D-2-hydroxyacid dehydrogenase [Sphingorhabdus sp. Alg239-R122]